MKPLDALGPDSPLPLLLASAKPADVEAALVTAEGTPSEDPLYAPALLFAKAAWALREGRLETARVGFDDAASHFERRGETEAAELCRIEGAAARARRGRRDAALEAEALVAPLEEGGSTADVRARATLARGTAFRVLGDASKAQASFARALELSRDLPDVRSMALNSLGTLCVSLAAFGAADTLCEHAAELCRIKKDVVGEAIAMGQLGAAALGRGDLAQARKFLSRQEWLSSQVGDAFGRTRALVWLAEVALEAGRADDAAMLASRAIESANTVTPPLSTFIAYAERALGRARLAMGEPAGREDIARACATFTSQKLPLGEALSARDVALARQPLDRAGALVALRSLAALGLPERIAEILSELDADAELELALVAPSARRLEPLEARLVYENPDALARVAEQRSGSRKNLSRLAVLGLEEKGLRVAAIGLPSSVRAATLVDDSRISGALVGGLPGLVLLAWPASSLPHVVATDLDHARERAKDPLRVAIGLAKDARVSTPGFGGGLTAEVEDLDASSLLGALQGLAPGQVKLLDADTDALAWRPALEKLGFTV